MRKLILICISALGVFTVQSQTVDSSVAARAFLQGNIRYLFIPQPNSSEITFRYLNNDSLALNTNGIVFGRTSNGGMNVSAQLVLSLFRPQNNGGDTLLQLALWRMIRVKGKKLILAFLNDTRAPLNETAITNFHPYRQNVNGGDYVYPGAFPVSAGMPNAQDYFALIILGEKILGMNSVLSARVDVLNIVTRSVFNDNTVESFSTPFWFTAGANQPMYMFLQDDQRNCALQGLSNAMITLLYNRESALLDTLVETCFNRGLVRWTEPDSRAQAGVEAVPTNFWLRNCLIRESLDPLTRAMPANAFPRYRDTYRNICVRDLPPKYLLRNEITIGVICNRFVSRYGHSRFFRALIGPNDLSEIRGDNLGMAILENLCQDIIAGNGGTSPVRLGGMQLMPIVLADFICRWRLTDGTSTTFAMTTASPNMRNWLTAYHTSIKSAVQETVNGLPSSATLSQQIDAILNRLNTL